MINYFFILTVSFVVVFLVTPSIRYVALKFYVIDKINYRKVHKKLVTKLGGLAIWFGFLAGLFIVVIFDSNFFRSHFYLIVGLLTCSGLMLVLGGDDDFHGSSALQKLIIQIIISLLAIKTGIILKGITVPGLFTVDFGIFSILLTVLWLVGITNAINLIDGLDGLAAGIIGIASFFIFLCSLILKDNFNAYLTLALMGACFGFLKYNFTPAKIFMGDTGSLFLGFTIAYLSLCRKTHYAGINVYVIPVMVILTLPILDTVFAVIRRVLGKKNIFLGDSSHIHHYFIKRGFSQLQTVLLFYFVTFLLGVASLGAIFLYK